MNPFDKPRDQSVAYVAHIIPHLGGGVGRVLMNLIGEYTRRENHAFEHCIVCFEVRTLGRCAATKKKQTDNKQ